MARRHHRPYCPSLGDHTIASRLGEHAAWLADGETVFALCSAPDPVSTPVLSLVQAIWERSPAVAHALLRRRILTTSVPDPLDDAVVQLAAKRLSHVSALPTEESFDTSFALEDLSSFAVLARDKCLASVFDPGMSLLQDPSDLERFLPHVIEEMPLAHRDRPLVAALLGPEGRVWLAARNTAGRNRTQHAELNLVQAWWMISGERLPRDCRIVCSLRPCRMCAAMIVRAAQGPVEVGYLRDDPGRLAQGTVLERLGWQHEITSPHPETLRSPC